MKKVVAIGSMCVGCVIAFACGGSDGDGGGDGGKGATGGTDGGKTGGSGGTDAATGGSTTGGKDGRGTGGGGTGGASGSGGTVGECSTNEDCEAKLPATEPAGCAEGKCDVLLNTCTFKAKDSDGDGHTTQVCTPIGAGSIQTGDDCDDADASTYPGAPDTCDGKIHTCASTACLCANGETKACGNATTCNAAAVETCVDGNFGVCDPPPKTTCAPNSIQACTTCSSLSNFSSGQHICNNNCDFVGTYCTPTGGSWTANSSDSVFGHDCGSHYTQTGLDVWMAFPASSTQTCFLQKGPGIKLPRGRYKWTFMVTVLNNGGLSFDVARDGVTVPPPDGPQPDYQCPWNGSTCPPGVITIVQAEANVSQIWSIDFGVPDECGANYDLRVRAFGTSGYVMMHYNTLSWVGTY